MYQFDEDTAIAASGAGRFSATLTDRWGIYGVPNGGYLLAIGTKALLASVGKPDPLTATCHFVSRAKPGPLEIVTEQVKIGKLHETAAAVLLQSGVEIARILASFGDLGNSDGPSYIDGAPPPVPPADQLVTGSTMVGGPEITARFDTRYDRETVKWFTGAPSGRPEIRAWQSFIDGRPPDVTSLMLFADALPPPIFNVIDRGWAPTVELTVHVRARPAPGPLASRFITRFLSRGYLEEDGELWDQSGTLVAQSRQLAIAPRSQLA